MSLLFDQNLPRRLVGLQETEYPGSEHVEGAGLLGADDLAVWQYAAAHGLIVVSKDSDFRHLALLHGLPPKVIQMRVGNGPTAAVVALLSALLADVESFAADSDLALLVLPQRHGSLIAEPAVAAEVVRHRRKERLRRD